MFRAVKRWCTVARPDKAANLLVKLAIPWNSPFLPNLNST
jgi:hypothetical protein